MPQAHEVPKNRAGVHPYIAQGLLGNHIDDVGKGYPTAETSEQHCLKSSSEGKK